MKCPLITAASTNKVVGAMIASILQDPMIYVSGGGEHQGPPGGGPVAVISKRSEN
ncbi:MAG: ring-opening amidohydrolase [Phormidesmis sp.]